jgi:hypothetical protein
MRWIWSAALVLVTGCDDAEPTIGDEYDALEARVEVDCGTVANNYPPDANPPPALCGEEPDVACLNAAIESGTVARFTYLYYVWDDNYRRGLLRESEYFAADGSLVWFLFVDDGNHDPLWYRRDCAQLVATPYAIEGNACWTLTPVECSLR